MQKGKFRLPSNSNTTEAQKERLHQSNSASHNTWRAESSFHRPNFIRSDEDWYWSVRRSSSLALGRAVPQCKEEKLINVVVYGLFHPNKILLLIRTILPCPVQGVWPQLSTFSFLMHHHYQRITWYAFLATSGNRKFQFFPGEHALGPSSMFTLRASDWLPSTIPTPPPTPRPLVNWQPWFVVPVPPQPIDAGFVITIKLL